MLLLASRQRITRTNLYSALLRHKVQYTFRCTVSGNFEELLAGTSAARKRFNPAILMRIKG